MPQEFTNFASTVLEEALNIGTNTFKVSANTGDLFPILVENDDTSFSMITLEDASGNVEIVKAVYRNGDNFLVDGRGAEGTTEQSFAAGSRVELRFTAGTLNEFIQRNGDTINGGNTQLVTRYTTDGAVNLAPGLPGEVSSNIDTVQPKLYLTAEDGSMKIMAEPLYVFEKGTNPPANVGHGAIGYELPAGDIKVFDEATSTWLQASYSTEGGTISGHVDVKVDGVEYLRTTANADGENTKAVIFNQGVGVSGPFVAEGETVLTGETTFEGTNQVTFKNVVVSEAGILMKTRILREDAGAHLFWDTPLAESGGRIYTDVEPPNPDNTNLNIGDIWLGF